MSTITTRPPGQGTLLLYHIGPPCYFRHGAHLGRVRGGHEGHVGHLESVVHQVGAQRRLGGAGDTNQHQVRLVQRRKLGTIILSDGVLHSRDHAVVLVAERVVPLGVPEGEAAAGAPQEALQSV
eukprot:4303208-Pyramimonas_sp.AAC.2